MILKLGRILGADGVVHHEVAAEQIGEHLLVRFRNMYIREMDLVAASTLPFIHPVRELGGQVSPMS
jgi:hypothetical protein